MRRVVTIDQQPDSESIAVWTTTRTSGLVVDHTNAVVIHTNDPDAQKIAHALTRDCAVLITDGSVVDGLPIEGTALGMSDIDTLVAATEEHQAAILAAVEDYRRRTRSKTLVSPEFPPCPLATDFQPSEDTPGHRALSTASYLAKAWNLWLRTEEERRRRTARPRTGETPWIMPDALNDPEIAALPQLMTVRIHEQPLA